MRLPVFWFLMILITAPASAQDWNNLATSEAINQAHAAMRQNMIVNPAEDGNWEEDSPTSIRRSDFNHSYRTDMSVRREVQAGLVANVASQNKEAASQLAATFARHDLIAMGDRAFASLGLKSGNVMDAIAVYRLSMWGAANELSTPPHREIVAGIKQQIIETIDLSEAGLDTPEDKQRFSETLLYQAILMDLAMEQAIKAGNTTEKNKIRQAARRALLESGINPDGVYLTRNGFTPIH